jgi:hypothetical protein
VLKRRRFERIIGHFNRSYALTPHENSDRGGYRKRD